MSIAPAEVGPGSSPPLPYRVFLCIIVLLTIAGLANAAYLAVAHYRVYLDIGYASFCAISKTINCDTVSQSPHSIFLGMPVAAWGVFGYLLLGLLLIVQRFPVRPESASDPILLPLLLCVSFLFCMVSVVLGVIMATLLSSYCILCILSFAINFCLLYVFWIMHRRFASVGFLTGLKRDGCHVVRNWSRAGTPLLVYFLVLFISMAVFPSYWDVALSKDTADLPRGVTEEGLPWIGAENPILEIVEFADYQCFQCRKMHFYLRRLMARYPNRIRLVHRHYPMDHEFNFIVKEPFYIGSGKLALLALHARMQGRFWEMNDLLYRVAAKKGEVDLQQLADETGLDWIGLKAALVNPGYRKRLEIDIRYGMKLRVLGTPSYLIDGRIYQGEIPAGILSAAVNR